MSDRLPRIFGPYVLQRELGAGSGGTVYLARPLKGHVGWPDRVVVKLLHSDAHDDQDYVSRFKHEAHIAVRVDHINVVRVFDAGQADGLLYIAMDFVDGYMLSMIRNSLAEREVLIPLPIAHALALQLVEGVVALHGAQGDDGESLSFVHRDLSPRNVMLGEDGVLRVIDFGLGRSALQDWKTRPGTTLGSAGYMPPEQAAGDAVDQTADIFAAAAVAYELFTGERMIAPGKPLEMLHRTIAHRYVPMTTVRPEVPSSIDRIVEMATQQIQTNRFESAADMLAALRATALPIATAEEVATFIRVHFGPVEPVPLSDEGDETDLTEAPAHETVVFARRPGLVAPMIPDSMYLPTRAEVTYEQSATVRPEPTRHLALVAGAGMALVFVVMVAIVGKQKSTVVALPVTPAEEVVAVEQPNVRAIPRPMPEARTPPSIVERAEQRPPPAARTHPPRLVPKPVDPSPPVKARPPAAPPQIDVAASLRKMQQRADLFRRRDDTTPDQQREVLGIILQLTRLEEVAKNDPAGALRKVTEVRSRLDRLVQQPPE